MIEAVYAIVWARLAQCMHNLAVAVQAGLLMVNAWVQGLTGPQGHDFPNFTDVSFSGASMTTDRAFGGTGESDADCEVCSAQCALFTGNADKAP